MVTIGSVAISHPELLEKWLQQYGPDRIILGADTRNGKISVNGWKEDSDTDLFHLLDKFVALGVKNVLCTDISKDGTMRGPAIDLYKEIMHHNPTLHLIASGGVSSNADIIELDQADIPAVVFGKAFYEGKIDINELRKNEK